MYLSSSTSNEVPSLSTAHATALAWPYASSWPPWSCFWDLPSTRLEVLAYLHPHVSSPVLATWVICSQNRHLQHDLTSLPPLPSTYHPMPASQTTSVQEVRSVPLVACCPRMIRIWRQTHFNVQLQTLLRWHRELFRLFWKRKSKADARQPKLSPKTIALIKEMARINRRLRS
jgi:hypothetical protein